MKKPKNVKLGFLAEIAWIDSIETPGWQTEIQNTDLGIRSVGIIIGADKNSVTITTSVTSYAAFDSPLSIPWCAITKFKHHCKIAEFKEI